MKPTLLALFFIALYSGCASTTLYSHGQKVAVFQSNIDGLVFHSHPDGSIDFAATRLNNSTPTRAAGSLIGTAGTAVSGIVTAGAVFAK